MRRVSLLWWVFLANGSVLLVAFLVLALSPIEIHAPITLGQLGLLFAGLVLMLAVNLVLLRQVLSPLFKLSDVMGSVDPDNPGRRLAGINPRSAEGVVLTEAFNSMLDRLESGRREASRMALNAQEAEKARVARELHDEIGQMLTAVMLRAERAAEGDPAAAADELAHVADAVRASLEDVRRIARELRPEALDDLGLVNALIALCSRFDAQDGPRIRRELPGKLPPLAPDVELVIYRVAQESLTNVVRHASATSATVSVELDDERLVLSVRDDGRGMPDDVPRDTAGISGMRERAMLIDARLEIASDPARGTTVQLIVPIGGDA
ncbi:MAG: sensor histidine kinase [Actinomycetota bacterium]|nr:sensor histidine kinase [Actinomycetota bacterium]